MNLRAAIKASWKPALLVLVLLGGVGFAAVQWRSAFRGRAPAFMKIQEVSSPALWTDGRLRRSWPRVEQMIKQAGFESKAIHADVRSLVLVDVLNDRPEALVWETQEVINPGFAPMDKSEGWLPRRLKKFVGYYSLDGKPLRYLAKKDPRRGDEATFSTILLDQPVAPGQTGLIFRVENDPDWVNGRGRGRWEATGRPLPAPATGLHGFGVGLPSGMAIESYRPADEAFSARRDDGVLTMWFNSVLPEDRRAPTIAFGTRR